MDPYLEASWGDVQTRLAVYACDQLAASLPADLRARGEESVFVRAEPAADRPGRLQPDIHVRENPAGKPTLPVTSLVGVAEPLVVARRPRSETFTQRSVRIIDTSAGGKLVTAIEVLSPANKAEPVGRRAYRRKCDEVLLGGASLVELDLLRAGHYVISAAEEEARPPTSDAVYLVCVSRASDPERAEVYRMPLRERLPAVRVPLRPTDTDAILDLQALVAQADELGRHDDTDYTRDPDPPLEGEDAIWADGLLREKGLRR
jgi:hypothetical protein